jgi:hypothetical protein
LDAKLAISLVLRSFQCLFFSGLAFFVFELSESVCGTSAKMFFEVKSAAGANKLPLDDPQRVIAAFALGAPDKGLLDYHGHGPLLKKDQYATIIAQSRANRQDFDKMTGFSILSTQRPKTRGSEFAKQIRIKPLEVNAKLSPKGGLISMRPLPGRFFYLKITGVCLGFRFATSYKL